MDLTSDPERSAGNRLAELVQVLTGCTLECAELAMSGTTPTGPTSSEVALRTMAHALVRLRAPAGLTSPGTLTAGPGP